MMSDKIRVGNIDVHMSMALENICVAQDGIIYNAITEAIDFAESQGDDPRKVIEQVILALVIYTMSYNLNFKVVKRVMDIYRTAVRHIASAGTSSNIAEA